MKIIKLMVQLFIVQMLVSSLAIGQSTASEWKYIFVREDVVKPSMTEDYEASLADLKLLLGEGKVKDFSYYTHLQDNYNFVHFTPLTDLKDIEKSMVEIVAGKVNMTEFNLIWPYLTSTIGASRNYLLRYRPELSYAPDNIYWGEKTPYRRWNYLYFSPGSEKNIEKVLKAWKTLYEKKKVSSGFRIFSGFIGVERPLYIFTTWAEDPLDFQNKLVDAIELLGDEGTALWAETMNYVREVETVEGWFLPQYSYVPEK